MNYCFVVPHYNHLRQFENFLPALIAAGLPCIVVDDGSTPDSLRQLEALAAEHKPLHLFCHTSNRGKGAAVITGCYHARQLGFSHVIQIDADGQHHPADAQRFIAASEKQPAAIVSGMPVFDASAPAARKHGRKISVFWVALETLSLAIKDVLCGYRVYPLATVEHLVDHYHIGARMDFDTDMLVKAKWSGFPVLFVDTEVRYIESGVSHFHYLRDNLRLIALHTRLLAQAPFRLLARTVRQLSGRASVSQ